MAEYELKKDAVDVPRNTGVEGFVHTIRSILRMPRVQSIHIDSKGKVTYERYVQDGEPVELGDVGFEELEPWHIIRNGEVMEISPYGNDPTMILWGVFRMASHDGLVPTAWVTGANSILDLWLSMTGGPSTDGKALFGLPVNKDRNLPDTVLILAAAYTRDGGLVDTQKSYKIEMERPEMPDNGVEVI